jgi:hypothetical protein
MGENTRIVATAENVLVVDSGRNAHVASVENARVVAT